MDGKEFYDKIFHTFKNLFPLGEGEFQAFLENALLNHRMKADPDLKQTTRRKAHEESEAKHKRKQEATNQKKRKISEVSSYSTQGTSATMQHVAIHNSPINIGSTVTIQQPPLGNDHVADIKELKRIVNQLLELHKGKL